MNFTELSDNITLLTARAQATFLYTLTQKMGPNILRTLIRYCYKRLDEINSQLPERPVRTEQENTEFLFNGTEQL